MTPTTTAAPKGQMLTMPEVIKRLGIPRTLLYTLMDREVRPFPPGVRFGRRRLYKDAING